MPSTDHADDGIVTVALRKLIDQRRTGPLISLDEGKAEIARILEQNRQDRADTRD